MAVGKAKNRHVDKQIKFWHERKNKIEVPQKILLKKREDTSLEKDYYPFITISREYGCGGYEVASELSDILKEEYDLKNPWVAYDKEVLNKVMDDIGICQSLVETLTANARKSLTEFIQTAFSDFPSQVKVYKKLVETIILLAENGHVIIVGRAGNWITRDMKSGFHVRMVANMDWKVYRISTMLNIPYSEAKSMIIKKSKERDSFMKKYVKCDVTDPHNYHILINNSLYTTHEVANLVLEGMRIKGLLPHK